VSTTKFDRNDPRWVGLYADSARVAMGIEMINGERFTFLEPKVSMIDPEVIAHAIANLCRFTGHTRQFYSVAQHCVIVSELVPEGLALQGLLHDASEAFIGDVSRPLKAVMDDLAPGVLHDIEERIHEVIAKRFKSGFPHDPEIKAADNVCLATEKRDLMAPASRPWLNMPEPMRRRIDPWGPAKAKRRWLERFAELGGE